MSIPEPVLQIYWAPDRLDEHDTKNRIDRFVDRSLARLDEAGHLRLHSLQHDFLRKQTADLRDLHTRLLNAYAACCPNGWLSGANDGYFFQKLAYHLAATERYEELRNLLLNSDWLQLKLDATDVNALIADYDLLPYDAELRLVQGAISLAAHILARDKKQLAGQLLGRLPVGVQRTLQELLQAGLIHFLRLEGIEE